MEEKAEKSLSSWRLELQKLGKSHWLRFYESFLGSPVSNRPRFYKALSLYGDWALFESVLATSTATIEGDPLNYCLKVAYLKWKEAQQDEEDESNALSKIEEARKDSQKKNDDLAKRLERAKKKGSK